MKVSVSGRQFVFPRTCACCGSFPLTTLAVSGSERNRLSRTRGWVWDVPHCVACKQHILAAEMVQVGTLLLIAVSAIGATIVSLLSRSWLFGVILLLGWLIAIGLIAITSWALVRRSRPANCTGMGRAVRYLGSDRTCHSFYFQSGFYAAEFVRANESKIVNASAKVAGILKSTGHGEHQVPRRLINKRH